MLTNPKFLEYLLAAFHAPAASPPGRDADITHLGPGRVALALSMVMLSLNERPPGASAMPGGAAHPLAAV